jgi:hypothetical protein
MSTRIVARPAPLNYASLSIVILTPSVLIFGFEGGGTRLLRWLQRVFGIMTALGLWLFLSTVVVVHDNWACYKSQDVHDVNYGRCTERSARIRRMPNLQAPSHPFSLWHNWTEAMSVFVYVFVGIAAMNLVILATRLILIRLDLARMSIPASIETASERPEDEAVHHFLKTAREAAHNDMYFRPRADQSLVHLAHHIRNILVWDVVSFILCFPAIAMQVKLGGLHLVFQLMLCGTAGTTLALYLFTHYATWKWWLMITLGSLALLIALLHHMIMSSRMLHHIHSLLPVANAAIIAHARDPIKTTHAHHIHDIVSSAVQMAST